MLLGSTVSISSNEDEATTTSRESFSLQSLTSTSTSQGIGSRRPFIALLSPVEETSPVLRPWSPPTTAISCTEGGAALLSEYCLQAASLAYGMWKARFPRGWVAPRRGFRGSRDIAFLFVGCLLLFCLVLGAFTTRSLEGDSGFKLKSYVPGSSAALWDRLSGGREKIGRVSLTWKEAAALHAIREDGRILLVEGWEHPIPKLVNEAEKRWDALARRQSTTFAQAVMEYRRRNNRDPPRGFDQW